MQFRESVAFNHDLISDKKSYLVKKKPIDVPVRGFATVEIFDCKTGEKKLEAKTENILTNRLSRLAFMDYYYNKIKTGSLFKYICITDSTTPEDPEVKRVLGNVIGWGDRDTPYSGSSTFQGTINQAETKLDVDGDGLLHFVFDFPTHACNGTFQSIFWIETTNFYNMTLFKYVNTGDSFSNGIGAQDSQYFYANAANQKSIYRYNKDTFIKDNTPIDFSAVSGVDSIQSISIYNDVYYIVPSTKNKLIKVNKSLSKLGEIALSLPSGMAYTDLYSITMLPSGIYGVGKNSCLVKWNHDGTINQVAASALNMAQYYRVGALCFSEVNEGIIVAGSSGSPFTWNGMIDKNTLSEKYSGRAEIKSSQGYYLCGWQIFYDDTRNMFYTLGGDGNSYEKGFRAFTVPMPAAQTLLASPVTKTPTNTMKIQYDFQIQKVY